MADDRDARIAQLEAENAALSDRAVKAETALAKALEQQTALGEVLAVIASAPSDANIALQRISEIAWRLGKSSWAGVRLVDGDQQFFVAAAGDHPWLHVVRESLKVFPGTRQPIDALAPSGEAVRTRETVHIDDVQSSEMRRRYPDTRQGQHRTTLHVPLLREGRVIGLLSQSRNVVAPYSPVEIALLEAFANQAVIAIENARLFADLTEALEQQTATAEILVLAQDRELGKV